MKAKFNHQNMKKMRGVPPLTPAEIKAIRKRERCNQAEFAYWLNVSKNTVSEWERGKKKPSGSALLLLAIVKHRGIDAIIFFGGVSREWWLSDTATLDFSTRNQQREIF